MVILTSFIFVIYNGKWCVYTRNYILENKIAIALYYDLFKNFTLVLNKKIAIYYDYSLKNKKMSLFKNFTLVSEC